jgi:hypothetical protein
LDLQGDGFLFGPTGDTGRKISYGEVASVELDNPGTSRRFFDVLGRVTYHLTNAQERDRERVAEMKDHLRTPVNIG